jgi:hypothetical protein
MSEIDKGYLKYCITDVEVKNLTALIEHGSHRKAGEAIGVSHTAIGEMWRKVKARAEQRGFFPHFGMPDGAPPGYIVKGTSTYSKENRQWVKTDRVKRNLLEGLQEAVEDIIKPTTGLAPHVPAPRNVIDDFLVEYPVADPHVGMFAWGMEAGHDYDLDIAEGLLVNTMGELVESSPATRTCLISNLADFFHADSQDNKTARSGNVLDVDTRWGKVMLVGERAYKHMILLALKKHEKVIVKSGIGNHDDHCIIALAMLMKAWFHNEPRVEIHVPSDPFAYHEFGKNLIGIHHGMIKAEKMGGIMAADMPEAWGRTTHRKFHIGHLHSKGVIELPGCTVERFRSVAPNDAWAHGAGYRSLSAMEAIYHDIKGGEHGRRTVNIRR